MTLKTYHHRDFNLLNIIQGETPARFNLRSKKGAGEGEGGRGEAIIAWPHSKVVNYILSAKMILLL